MADTNLDTWPDALRRIAEVIGADAALKLASVDGGLDKVYVPREARESHRWASVLGMEAFAKLARAFGGERIDIPRGAHINLKKRRIIELAETGMAHRQIAREVGTGERYVRDVLSGGDYPAARARGGADPRQLKMF